MSKKTAPAVAYTIGDRVTATTAATLQEPANGVIADISKSGWYIVVLDEPDRFLGCKGGKLSARISSLQAESPAPAPKAGGIASQLQAANTHAEPPKADKPPKTPKPAHVTPTACPECGNTDLDVSKDEDGSTTYACTDEECGWELIVEPDPEHASRMAEALRKARAAYTRDRRPDGSATAHCNDAIAKELRDLEPREVADLADKVLAQAHGFHFGKYGHLNNGQIRMNSGNRIRAYWKQINADGAIQEISRVGKLLNLDNAED